MQASPHAVGSSINLSCNVDNLNFHISTNANLQWSDFFGKPLTNLSASNSLSYTINNIKLSDAGQYNCSSYVTTTVPHPYILTSENTTAATVISVISKSTISLVHFCYFYIVVPNKYSSDILLNLSAKSYYKTGSSIVLNCNVYYYKSIFIDVNTSLYMEWCYRYKIENATAPLNENMKHTITYTISEMKLSDAGQYNCSYYIDTTVYHAHIQPSVIKTIFTNITAASK